MASKRQQRNVLTLKRKIDLLKDIETKQLTQTEIAKKYKVAQPTVCAIVKNGEQLKQKFYSGETSAKRKRERCPGEPKVDSALLDWFHNHLITALRLAYQMCRRM